MSSDKSESESTLNGPVLVNGMEMEGAGRESPGVGVSGNKPMVNGDLRDVGDGGEADFVAVKTPLDGINNSTHEDAAVKQSSSVSLIVSGGSAKAAIGATSKPRSSSYHSRPQQHRLPPLGYYRYVLPATHQPTPLFYSPQTYLGSGGMQGGGMQGGGMQGGGSQLSSTNLYIRGLSEKCCDEDLTRMCQQYGKIVSTKAILDKETNCCKGYGFVDFENPADAMRAVHSLMAAGVMAQFAKVPQQQEQDPTNLYFSNLPKTFDEKELEGLVSPYGAIISTRILRDQNNTSRGVGFVRLDTKESCEKTIEMLNGSTLQDSSEPLMVKFADSSSNKKRQYVTGRWRDIEYMYDGSHMLAQNGLVGSRVVQQGMLASQYLQTPTHQMSGYQVPVSQTMSTGAWQPTYYVQPSVSTVEL
ncbi:Protein alan shepard [Geodia barretti]|uniref:Protein alan shepard n=1 Tax=Geodia barretti TaxID=519541 RepID=A0AA35RT39_GEOBA|nr:Protein alan shepard [Geodia barretti]